ncbi:MAG: gamma-glutamyl-gamma-aminobutyrate hydrolase family protein [Candidatus Solibacter sp.]
MKVLAFRHVPFEGAGLIEPVLAAHNVALDYADLYLPGAVMPDVSQYNGLIVLGGPMSANDDLAYLRTEMDMLRAEVLRGRPVLGICLGSQLLARALGAEVRRNPVKEIGWYPVECSPAADGDPLLAGLSGETVFHWHGETFDLPPGAELLASSERCLHQAYRVGARAYGFQFHLEVTPEMIADWCLQDENCGDMRELVGPLDPRRGAARLRELSARVFGGWCRILHHAGRSAIGIR